MTKSRNNSLISRAEEVKVLRLARGHPQSQAEFISLTTRIRKRIMNAVAATPSIREYFGSRRHRILGADLFLNGTEQGVTLRIRHAEVAVYDYDHDLLVTVIVDLKSSKVVQIREHPGHQPPPSAAEVTEAGQLAIIDPALARKTPGKRVRVTASIAREATMEGHPSRGHRILSVVLWAPTRQPRRLAGPILVDLSHRRIVEPMLPRYAATEGAG